MATHAHSTGAPGAATPTRHLMLSAAGIAALAVTTPAVAEAGADAELLTHWQGRQRCLAQIVSAGSFYHAETHSPDTTRTFDAHEAAIPMATAGTIRGALTQAWVAWGAQGIVRNANDLYRNSLIRSADYGALARMEEDGELDWDDSTMLAVVRSLQALAGEA